MGKRHTGANVRRMIRDALDARRAWHAMTEPSLPLREERVDPASSGSLARHEEAKRREIVVGARVVLPHGAEALVEEIMPDHRVRVSGWDAPFSPAALEKVKDPVAS